MIMIVAPEEVVCVGFVCPINPDCQFAILFPDGIFSFGTEAINATFVKLIPDPCGCHPSSFI